jgi:hypothetical protein
MGRKAAPFMLERLALRALRSARRTLWCVAAIAVPPAFEVARLTGNATLCSGTAFSPQRSQSGAQSAEKNLLRPAVAGLASAAMPVHQQRGGVNACQSIAAVLRSTLLNASRSKTIRANSIRANSITLGRNNTNLQRFAPPAVPATCASPADAWMAGTRPHRR